LNGHNNLTSSDDSRLQQQTETDIFINVEGHSRSPTTSRSRSLTDTAMSLRRGWVYDDQLTRSCDAHAGGLESNDLALMLHESDIRTSRCDVDVSASSLAASETPAHNDM